MNDTLDYPLPQGLHAIPLELLDARPDSEIDYDILRPKLVANEKNVWFFWHSGYEKMYPYTKRNVRAWYRRLSKKGWIIRVIDLVPGSSFNVANFLDVSDPGVFPRPFTKGVVGGLHSMQHASDLVRFPLLVRYGGVYADVGMLQIGDVDRLWNDTIANPESRYEVVSYNFSHGLTNYFLMSNKGNPLFEKCHRLFLALWAEDDGKIDTEGMHTSPLLKGIPLVGGSFTIKEGGKTLGPEEVTKILNDYLVQGLVITMVMGLVDEEEDWNGPQYSAQHVFAMDYMVGSQLINILTDWDGKKAFDLMSLSLPKEGEIENVEQKQAREILEACLQKSFGFKLAHGLILKVMGCTLGSLWRDNEGSDDIPGTYAHWLRYAMTYCNPNELPSPLEVDAMEPFKRGPLLREV